MGLIIDSINSISFDSKPHLLSFYLKTEALATTQFVDFVLGANDSTSHCKLSKKFRMPVNNSIVETANKHNKPIYDAIRALF